MTLRYTSPDGRTWRVVDICFGVPPASRGRAVKLPLGDPRATSRCFLPDDGVYDVSPSSDPAAGRGGHRLIRNHHLDEPGATRATDPETLAAQFRCVYFWDPRPLEDIMRPYSDPNYGRSRVSR